MPCESHADLKVSQLAKFLKGIVKSVSKCRTLRVRFVPTPQVEMWDIHTGGGTYYEYRDVDCRIGSVAYNAEYMNTYTRYPGANPVATLKPGCMLVKSGSFCGSPSSPTIYVCDYADDTLRALYLAYVNGECPLGVVFDRLRDLSVVA
jgi:hypothetical protein